MMIRPSRFFWTRCLLPTVFLLFLFVVDAHPSGSHPSSSAFHSSTAPKSRRMITTIKKKKRKVVRKKRNIPHHDDIIDTLSPLISSERDVLNRLDSTSARKVVMKKRKRKVKKRLIKLDVVESSILEPIKELTDGENHWGEDEPLESTKRRQTRQSLKRRKTVKRKVITGIDEPGVGQIPEKQALDSELARKSPSTVQKKRKKRRKVRKKVESDGFLGRIHSSIPTSATVKRETTAVAGEAAIPIRMDVELAVTTETAVADAKNATSDPATVVVSTEQPTSMASQTPVESYESESTCDEKGHEQEEHPLLDEVDTTRSTLDNEGTTTAGLHTNTTANDAPIPEQETHNTPVTTSSEQGSAVLFHHDNNATKNATTPDTLLDHPAVACTTIDAENVEEESVPDEVIGREGREASEEDSSEEEEEEEDSSEEGEMAAVTESDEEDDSDEDEEDDQSDEDENSNDETLNEDDQDVDIRSSNEDEQNSNDESVAHNESGEHERNDELDGEEDCNSESLTDADEEESSSVDEQTDEEDLQHVEERTPYSASSPQAGTKVNSKTRMSAERTVRHTTRQDSSPINNVVSKSDLIVSAVTWNLAEESPSETDAEFIKRFRKGHGALNRGSDLILFGGQECENIKPRRSEGHRSREFRRLVILMLGKEYVPLALHMIGGIQFGLFCRRSIIDEIEHASIADVTCGVGNVFHNKGAIGCFLQMKARAAQTDGDRHRAKTIRLLFVAAHMAAHVKNTAARDADFWRIMGELEGQAPPRFLPQGKPSEAEPPGSRLLQHIDKIIFCGDLNYRIELPREEVELNVMEMKASTNENEKVRLRNLLLRHDQLKESMALGRAFPGFSEGQITFPPTFKFDKGTSEYDTSPKQRVPAWTDRIVFKGSGIRSLEYQSIGTCLHSDHRPVVGTLEVAMVGKPLARRRKRRRSESIH